MRNAKSKRAKDGPPWPHDSTIDHQKQPAVFPLAWAN